MGAISTILNTTYKLGKKKADEVEKIIKDNGYKITKIKQKDYPTYKKGTDSSKAFQEAFRQAVKDKKKTFTFEGRVYNTKKK